MYHCRKQVIVVNNFNVMIGIKMTPMRLNLTQYLHRLFVSFYWIGSDGTGYNILC